MTYVDGSDYSRPPLQAGKAADRINDLFHRILAAESFYSLDSGSGYFKSEHTALKRRLSEIQETLSDVSMHLPKGFANGLKKQFANMMDEEAWEPEDEPIAQDALMSFVVLLASIQPAKRPGLGTNGRGSVTAAWTSENARLTCECLPSGKVSVVLFREDSNGEPEQAAFTPLNPNRVLAVIMPFGPSVWFDG